MSHLSKPPLQSALLHPSHPDGQRQLLNGFTVGSETTIERTIEDPRIRKTIELLKANLQNISPLEAIAKIVNLSPSRLRNLFSEVIGLPLAHYVKLLRLEAARHLLTTEFLTVKEVMAKTGIKDPSHFNRDFKMTYGVTPSQYRNQSRRSDERISSDPVSHNIRQDL